MSDSANKPVLEVRNLAVSLPSGADRAHAVENVSFTVNPGEIVCLVGESGSGKSVCSQAIMGLLPRTAKISDGSILFDDPRTAAPPMLKVKSLKFARAPIAVIIDETWTTPSPFATILT